MGELTVDSGGEQNIQRHKTHTQKCNGGDGAMAPTVALSLLSRAQRHNKNGSKDEANGGGGRGGGGGKEVKHTKNTKNRQKKNKKSRDTHRKVDQSM